MLRFSALLRRFVVSGAAATVLLAGAGCQSTRSAYQFRPAPTVAATRTQPASIRPLAAAAPVVAAPAATAVPVAAPADAVVLTPVVQTASTAQLAPTARPAVAPKRLVGLLAAGRAAYAAALRPARRSLGATDGAQATAEVGLGTTVLGVLGLIVGPISLIGLLIWGGPVWAILLGLSALAVLVAYLDPFR